MSMDFDTLVEELIRLEGGEELVDDPTDRGGLTKFGISQRAYPQLDIASLTKQEAIDIYKRDYWDRMQLDQVPEEYREQLFFSGVVSGIAPVVKDLQRAVGSTEDGVMGPNTRKALEGFSGNLEREMVVAQANRYVAIAERDPTQRRFLNGWMNRTLGTDFSARGEDIRQLEPDDIRARIQEVADVQYPKATERVQLPSEDPSPAVPSFEPLGFLDNLTMLMDQRIRGASAASQTPSRSDTQPQEEEVVEESEPQQFNEAEESMISKLMTKGDDKLTRSKLSPEEEDFVTGLVDRLAAKERKLGPVHAEEIRGPAHEAELVRSIF